MQINYYRHVATIDNSQRCPFLAMVSLFCPQLLSNFMFIYSHIHTHKTFIICAFLWLLATIGATKSLFFGSSFFCSFSCHQLLMLLLLVPISFKLSILYEPLTSKTCKRNYKSWILSCYIAKVCVSHVVMHTERYRYKWNELYVLTWVLMFHFQKKKNPHENYLVRVS